VEMSRGKDRGGSKRGSRGEKGKGGKISGYSVS